MITIIRLFFTITINLIYRENSFENENDWKLFVAQNYWMNKTNEKNFVDAKLYFNIIIVFKKIICLKLSWRNDIRHDWLWKIIVSRLQMKVKYSSINVWIIFFYLVFFICFFFCFLTIIISMIMNFLKWVCFSLKSFVKR